MKMEELLNQPFDAEQVELSRRKLIDMRRRVANGDCIPEEELAEALVLIRKMYGREAQAAKPKKAAAKSKAKPKVNADDLLNDILGGL